MQQPKFQTGASRPFQPLSGPPGTMNSVAGLPQPPSSMGMMPPGPPRPGMPPGGGMSGAPQGMTGLNRMPHGPPQMPRGPTSMQQGPPRLPVGPGQPPTSGMPQLQQQMANVSLSAGASDQGPKGNLAASSPAPPLTNGLPSTPSPAPQHGVLSNNTTSISSMSFSAPAPPMSSSAPMPPMSAAPIPPMSGAPMPPMSAAPMPPMSSGGPTPVRSAFPMPRPGMPLSQPGLSRPYVSGMPPPSGPGMAPPSGPSMAPHSGPGMPAPSGHGMAPPSGPGVAPPSGHGMAPHSGHGMAPHSGHGMAPHSGHGMAPHSGHGMAPHSGHGVAPHSGHGMAPHSGHGMAPPSGPGMAPPSGPGMAPPSGHGMAPPSLPGMAPPSLPGMAPPSLSGMASPPLGPGMAPPHGSGMAAPHGSGMAAPHGSGMAPPHGSGIAPPPGPSMAPPPGLGIAPPLGPGLAPPPGPGIAQASPPQPSSAAGYMTGNMAQRYPGAQHGAQQQQQQHGFPQQQQHGYPQQQSHGYGQQQAARRLNPDDMPSPLQVIEEDRRARSGEFVTSARGALPPLATTKFVVRDGGNASPRYIRSTMYSVPSTPDLLKQTYLPFGLVINPLAQSQAGEQPLYAGTSLSAGPVRCNRCKAYMSPFMNFIDGGRRFQCQLCHQMNETPAEYYCNMDSQGARADKYQRPELCLGTYEYIATPEYCREKQLPKEPAFIFVLEMSQLMIQRGVISLLCQNMAQLLQHLPKDSLGGQTDEVSKLKVGFITYDSNVHFYKLHGQAPEMCVVCDKDEMFVPVPEGVLCDPNEVAENIAKLMDNIPQIFQGTKENSGVLGSAIQAGMSALKASGRTGKLFLFHSSLPQTEGPGKLKNREDRKLLGTDKEKSVLSPQSTYYNNLGQDLVSVGCGVDMFVFNDSYVDLTTIGQVCRLTGGQVFKYSFFQRDHDSRRLLQDLERNLSREVVFDAVMRVRTSTGIRAVDFYGHFFMANTQDMELACMDSNKAVAVEIKHDDKLTEDDGVCIQAALLYTSVGGQRRLRVINLSLNTCTQMAEMYKNCDLDTLMNFYGKMSMTKFLETTAKQVKEQFVTRTANILACYRKNCASPSAAGQLILPELLKLLPLYVNCLARCEALSGGQDITCDERALHIYHLTSCTIEASIVYYYPRLIPLIHSDDTPVSDVGIPTPVRTSYEKLRADGAFLLENGLVMYLWIGSNASSQWLNDMFGVNAPHQLDPTLSDLPEHNNVTSERVRSIVSEVRSESPLHMRLFVVPQQGKHEVVLRSYLVEDKGVYGAPSYVDFLCHIHKEIRALMQ